MRFLLPQVFSFLFLIQPFQIRAVDLENSGQIEMKTPSSRRASEVIELINSGHYTTIKSYIEKNYAPNFLKNVPVSAHLNFILEKQDESQGIDIDGVDEESDTQQSLIIRYKSTDERYNFSVSTETDFLHKITQILIKEIQTNASPIVGYTRENATEDLDRFVSKLVDLDLFSGAILIAYRGRPFYRKAFGMANRDFAVPNNIETKFNLGSMNKMFTAVAIAQLVQNGELSFDDPLSKFFPQLPNPEDAKEIKIKHLLSHTSGLGSYWNKKFLDSSRTRFRTIEDMMTLIDDSRVAFRPGSNWKYSNTGYLVLGSILEKVTGQSYFDYIRENIYRPAGMVNSDCYELDFVNHNLAVGYYKDFSIDPPRLKNNIFEHVLRGGSAGGGYSTVDDLLSFDRALRFNTLINSQITKLVLSGKPKLQSPDYGFGFQIQSDPHIVGHGGGFPGISSNLDMFLDAGYTAIVMGNSDGGRRVAAKIKSLIRNIDETIWHDGL